MAVLWISSSFAQLNGYDEIFDEHGNVRPHYQTIYRAWEKLPAKKREELFKKSKEAFSGDNYLEILPRILTQNEFDYTVKPGIDQRAKALRAFLMDHYSGKKSYLKAGVIPGSVVKRALAKTVEQGFEGKLRPDRIAFIYAPDMIRDEHGVIRVNEDNPGYVGGLGDLDLAYKYLAKVYPQLKNLNLKKPEEFYRGLTDIFKNRAQNYAGEVVMYMMPHYSDNEDPRLRDILKRFGITIVTPQSVKQLKIESDGVYLYDKRKGFEAGSKRVGFVFVNGEHVDIDPSHFEVQKKLIRDEALNLLEEMATDSDADSELKKEIEKVLYSPNSKTGEINYKKLRKLINKPELDSTFTEDIETNTAARGLIQAILAGKVDSSYSPGVDFIGDKELYMYVPKFIEYYLGEQPILQNITTGSFSDAETGILKKAQFAEVFKNIKTKVIKPTDGRGGDGITIGPFASKADAEQAAQAVKESPGDFIYQDFVTLSHLRNLIVDMRGYAFIDGQGVWVGDLLFSRGLPMDRDKNGRIKGNGKVNLSDQGRELLVLVNRNPKNICLNLFSK